MRTPAVKNPQGFTHGATWRPALSLQPDFDYQGPMFSETDNEHHDATQAFLDKLPELKPGQTFSFRCGPDVPCYNACCSDLTLVITPYDTMRLLRRLGEQSEAFLNNRCKVTQHPGAGFPLVHLEMGREEGRPCPFVTPGGCSVYRDRPGACRTYPLGRASRPDPLVPDKAMQQFFIVKESHCRGFEEDASWTSETWLKDQGLDAYNEMNDRYMRLMAKHQERGRPVNVKQAAMLLLVLYQMDRFRDFIKDMRLFDRVEVSAERQEAILTDDEVRLAFALDWAELFLTGASDRLAVKQP